MLLAIYMCPITINCKNYHLGSVAYAGGALSHGPSFGENQRQIQS